MTSRTDWLDQGLVIVADRGISGLRIDSLARDLLVTKGSFYHHFLDLADYRRGLLSHFETQCTTRHIEVSRAAGDLTPLHRLLLLGESVLADDAPPGLEVGIRAWATQDDDAHDTMERVDARRLAYLNELVLGLLSDQQQAGDLSRAAYYLLIGSQHVMPPSGNDEIRRLWAMLLDIAGYPVDPVEMAGFGQSPVSAS